MADANTSKKIVIVDDNVSLAEIYKTRMELLGYTCFVAYDGEEALALIQKELPDLVLLDLMVPKIAGDQILTRMRSSDWGKNIKVLIISNLSEADAPKGLRELGIEGYSVKANLSDDQLDQIVDQIIRPADQTEDVSLETPGTQTGAAGSVIAPQAAQPTVPGPTPAAPPAPPADNTQTPPAVSS